MPRPGKSQKRRSSDSLARCFRRKEISRNNHLWIPESCNATWPGSRHSGPKKEARANSISLRAGSFCFAGYRLFDFDVIAGVNIRSAVGDKYGRRVAAHVKNYALSQHFTRQIIPVIPSRRAAKAIQTVLEPLGLGGKLHKRTLVTEYPKI